MSIVINGMDMPKGNSTKNLLIYSDGRVLTGHKDDINYFAEELPSVQPETCEGCKHLGKWENEVEYGYPSPCTRCKRRVGDHYER